MVIKALVTTLFCAAACSAYGAEYFVSRQGDDRNDGLGAEKAFLTIQKGVDALDEGDTLTIAPGEYFERVRRDNLGGPNGDTLIRAEIPGTVVLRGDVPAPAFQPVEGYRYVYAAEFDRDVQAVNEVDTLTIMETAPNVRELEFAPGGCYYDAAEKRLYISTSDMKPPASHHYTVSVTQNYGLFLHQPERVIVDGLSFTGFNSREMLAGSPGDYSVWGVMLAGARQCVIRRCVAFLNAGGISVNSGHFGTYRIDANGVPVYGGRQADVADQAAGPGGNAVEHCRAYGNYSRHSGSGGNIVVFNSDHDVIRDCVSYGSATHGIRHYGGIHGPAIARNNLSWGNVINDLHIKGGLAPEFGFAVRCVTLGPLHVAKVKHCIIGKENRYNSNPGADNFRYDLEARATRDREFADPDNLDFRLQPGSRFRGAGPGGVDRGPFPYQANIFYVKPEGDDQADGLSVERAWKTFGRAVKDLRAGDTLYLEAGEYDAGLDLKIGEPGGQTIAVRGRGTGTAALKGRLRMTRCQGVTFERVTFSDGVSLSDSRDVRFENCRFAAAGAGLEASRVDGLRLAHGFFTGFERAAVSLTACANVFLSGTIFDNHAGPALRLDRPETVRYSDYNNYRNPETAWEVNGVGTALASLQPKHERYSATRSPAVTAENGVPRLENPDLFAAGGPNGTALGVHREYREKGVRVSAPVARSVTPTTANIEWWTSLPARCEVAWGETPDCLNRMPFNSDGFGGLSLTGLKPRTKYYFKILASAQLSDPGNYYSVSTATPSRPLTDTAAAPLSFETAATLAEPVVYYVSPDGDDRNDGLAREKAFQTVSRAADQVNAGDTVLIAGGVYKETVRLRATGLPDRPITFKSIPGERVIFDGDNKTLARAFMASGKRHIRFDGLCFRFFSPGMRTSGIFCLYQCNDVRITRCFKDGRHGYSPSFVNAYGCADTVVRNCAIVSAFYGNLYMVKCPDTLIENNVLVRSLIPQAILVNEPEEKIRLRNNIITDNLPKKVTTALLEVACIESLVENDNCYYFRIPQEERRTFLFYDPVAYQRTVESYGLKPVEPARLFPNLSHITLPDFQQRSGNASSFSANPGFRGAVGMAETDKDGTPVFLVDRLLGKKDLDFPDLFATHPEVVRRGIGLEPGEFDGFKFAAPE